MNTKHWIIMLAVFSFSLLSTGWAGAAVDPTMTLGYNGGQNDNPHNLSSLNTNVSGTHASAGGEDRICVFCHTPHGASTTASPLWNRNDPTGPSGGFPLYAGALAIKNIAAAKYTNTDASVQYPNGASRMCLSCHDGVSAVGAVINGGSAGNNLASLTMPASAVIDLSTSHPISFVYNSTVLAGLAAVGETNYQLPAATSKVKLDSQNRMQCTTCHDPHVNTRSATYSLPMWADYTGNDNSDYSDTCDQCHGASYVPPSTPNLHSM